jgi:hypothetical protein
VTETPRWRHGNRQPRNLYVGDQVVGLVDSLEIAEQIIAAMNGDQERDERLRLNLAEDVEAEVMAHFDRTGDPGVREAAAVVRAYIARGLQRFAEPTKD